MLRILLHSLTLDVVLGHSYLTCPAPRMKRDQPIPGNEWTSWAAMVGESRGVGEGNAPNLNGGGREVEMVNSHGLCGGTPTTGFMAGSPFGPTDPRGTFEAGGVMRVTFKITAYHAGWVEFRLAVPEDGGIDKTIPITQDLLNQHVLEIDDTTPYYDSVIDYASVAGDVKCRITGSQAHVDSTASPSASDTWPRGSCCNGDGDCSPPSENRDRYVIERSPDSPELGVYGVTEYVAVLKVPPGVVCDRCVLQWYYQTANSPSGYPEGFWNCADIAIRPAGEAGPFGCAVGAGGSPDAEAPPDSDPPDDPASGGPPTGYIGFCATTWAEYGENARATCTPCNDAADCPAGRSCWGETWCTSSTKCGETAECGGAPAPSPSCGPATEQVTCAATPQECSGFTAACEAWCGDTCTASSTCWVEDAAYPSMLKNECSCDCSGCGNDTPISLSCFEPDTPPPPSASPSPPPPPSASPSPPSASPSPPQADEACAELRRVVEFICPALTD